MKRKAKSSSKSKSPSLKEKNYRIRFRDQAQIELIKDAAKHQGKSFNAFVIEVCEKTARVLLERYPPEAGKIISAAVNEALTER